MKKCFSILALFAAVFYSTAAFSKICFVMDEECQIGSYASDTDFYCSSSYNLSVQTCSSARTYTQCSDYYGVHFQEGKCKEGFCEVDMTKYNCDAGSCNGCCKNPQCPSSKYADQCKYPKVVKSRISENRYCVEIDSNCNEGKTIKVINESVDCECPDSYDKYCDGAAETGSGDACDGKYQSCTCGKGYENEGKTLDCEFGYETKTITGGKSCYKCKEDPNCPEGQMKESVAKDTCKYGYVEASSYGKNNNYKCYVCKVKNPDTCTLATHTDYDAFWHGYYAGNKNNAPTEELKQTCDKPNIVYDCAALGYNSGMLKTGEKCEDGTEPYRCLFNHEKVYCTSVLAGGGDYTYTCEDGGYLSAQQDGKNCTTVTYEGLTCYQCTDKVLTCNEIYDMEELLDEHPGEEYTCYEYDDNEYGVTCYYGCTLNEDIIDKLCNPYDYRSYEKCREISENSKEECGSCGSVFWCEKHKVTTEKYGNIDCYQAKEAVSCPDDTATYCSKLGYNLNGEDIQGCFTTCPCNDYWAKRCE